MKYLKKIKKYPTLLLLVGLVINFISYAEEPTPGEMLRSLEKMPENRNIHLQEMLTREYKNRIGQGYYDKVKLQEKEIEKVDSSVERILRRYKNIKTSEDMGSKFLMTNRLILDTVIAAGTALSGGTLGATLIASAVGVVASKGLDQVEKKFRQAHRESAQRELKYQLYKLRESGMNLDRFDGMDAENAAKIIFKEDFENSIDNQDLQVLNSARIKTLKDIIENQGIKNLELHKATAEEIQKNRENLGKLTQLYDEFGKQVRDDLVDIRKKQETINGKLNELNNRVNDNTRGIQKNRQDIEFIHEFMFGKMTPAEQRIALKKGWFKDMPEDEKKALDEKIRLVEEREELNKKVSDYLQGASHMVNIANALKIDPEIIKKAETGISIGNQAFNAFTNFTSGNYLAAASSIANIFGLGAKKRDIAGERHKQLVGMLKNVLGNQKVIMKKLDLLKQGQEQIMKNQQKIYTAVIELTEQVQKNHERVMIKLEEMHDDLLYNRKMLVQNWEQDFNPITGLIYINRDKGIKRIDTENRKYPPYKELRVLFDNETPNFLKIRETFNTYFVRNLSGTFHLLFWLESYKETANKNKLKSHLSAIYPPTWKYLEDHFEVLKDSKGECISSLFSPIRNYEAFNEKMGLLEDLTRDYPGIKFELLMKDVLSPIIIERYVNYLLDFHYYFLFLDGSNRLLSESDLFSGHPKRTYGLKMLRNAKTLIDIAIAQQTLLNGDILLPLMTKIYQEGKKDTDQYKDTIKLLEGNPLLAKNFLIYILKKEIDERGSNALLYWIALKRSSPEYLERINRKESKWEFHFKNEPPAPGWFVKLGSKFIPLPTAEEISAGEFYYSQALNILVKLRDRVLDEIMSYTFYESGLAREDRQLFPKLLMNGI